MARALNVTPVTAWRWESGNAGIPLSQLRAIAELLSVQLSELVPDEDAYNPGIPPVVNDPEEFVRLAQLALSASSGGDEEIQRVNEEVLERARRLRAAAARDRGEPAAKEDEREH